MRKIAALLGIFALVMVLSLPVAFAREEEKKIEQVVKKVENVVKAEKMPSDRSPSVNLKANGEFQVSGVKVNSVNASGNTLNVSLYGFSRDVNVSGARLIGAGKDITLADFRSGDILTASGRYQEATRTIQVEKIHNLSYQGVERSKIEARIEELLKMIEDLKRKLEGIR